MQKLHAALVSGLLSWSFSSQVTSPQTLPEFVKCLGLLFGFFDSFVSFNQLLLSFTSLASFTLWLISSSCASDSGWITTVRRVWPIRIKYLTQNWLNHQTFLCFLLLITGSVSTFPSLRHENLQGPHTDPLQTMTLWDLREQLRETSFSGTFIISPSEYFR